MASVFREPNGRRRLQFVAGDGTRKTIRLGAVSAKQAGAIKVRVEQLVSARVTGIMDPEAARWVGSLEDGMYARLSGAGLVPPRARATLGSLLDSFFDASSVKPSTRLAYLQARRALESHFGPGRALASISALDAQTWRRAQADQGLAPATISKRTHIAKQVFGRAVKWGMLAASPFADVKAGSQSNPARGFFVTREMTDAVLAKCPDDQWRLILALCRFGGLRCPSEVLGLRWVDVVWDRSRMIVRSPKTEGHEGKGQRVVPLFPELCPLLHAVFDAAEPGTEFVITRYRLPNVNLRTQLNKIIGRAGLRPWPRLFQNLRASCATELVQRFPAHVVGAWLGHSVAVAERHYLQVRDAHFDLAAGVAPDAGAKGDALAVQIAAQHPSAPRCTEPQGRSQNPTNPAELRYGATLCESLQGTKVGAGGFEPP